MSVVKFAGAFAALLLASGIAAAQGAKPNDAQIAHIAYTAGQLDIQAAEQALQKSKNKDVIAFAQDMERDHKAVNEQALALVKKLNVTPQNNDTSMALTKQAADKRAEIDKLSGAAFDKLSTTRSPITKPSTARSRRRSFRRRATASSRACSRPA